MLLACALCRGELRVSTDQWDGANLIVVVYDVSNRESFQSCTKWLQRVTEYLGRTIPGRQQIAKKRAHDCIPAVERSGVLYVVPW